MLAHELKACKADLSRFYDLQKKSGLYPSSLVKRRLEAMDKAIKQNEGEKDKPGIQSIIF